jgi:hypothetical protein
MQEHDWFAGTAFDISSMLVRDGAPRQERFATQTCAIGDVSLAGLGKLSPLCALCIAFFLVAADALRAATSAGLARHHSNKRKCTRIE